MVGIPAGIIAECRDAVHHAVVVKRRGIQADAPLKLVLEREHARAHMPVVARQVGKGASMPYPLHKATGLVTHGIVLLVGERAQWVVAHIDAVGIDLELGARGAVLEIILAVMLGHESPFHERLESHLVIVVHAEALPAVFVGLQEHQVMDFADRCEVFAADFNALDGIFVARAVVFVEPAIIVEEHIGVPGGQGVAFHGAAPAAVLGIGAVPDGQTLVGGAGVEQRVAHHPCGGSTLVIVGGKALERCLAEVPVTQVARVVETALVGREQVILALVGQSHRVGRRAERAALARVVVPRLVVVTDVERITVSACHGIVGVIPAGRLGRTARLGHAATGLDR